MRQFSGGIDNGRDNALDVQASSRKSALAVPDRHNVFSFKSRPGLKRAIHVHEKLSAHLAGRISRIPLKEIYGEYVQNLRPFAKVFRNTKIKNLEDVRRETLELMQKEEIDWEGDDEENPFHILLTHPKVAECAANMLNGAEQTRASIMQTSQMALALHQN